MKKSNVAAIALACAAVCGAVVFILAAGRRPYTHLDAEQIVSAAVRLTPPDKTVEIQDISALAEYLRDVVVYQRDDSYTDYDGQGVTFTLHMRDGTQTTIMAYNPFLVIDGVGYKAKYAPCEALNGYANQLLSGGAALVAPEEPPALSIVCGNTEGEALRGTYSWRKRNPDGTSTAIIADCLHPLESEELLVKFETGETTAVLRFAQDPDAILSARCWSEAHWGESGAESENAALEGFALTLKPGGYIYEISARWEDAGGCGGDAAYSFYVKAAQ